MESHTDAAGYTLVRRTLFFALALSLLANVGHTLLADSIVPVWLRMIGAVAWPWLVYLGVDITVKVAWDLISGRRSGIWLARLLILIPGVPAGITSYEHMHAVLLAMGERPFIAMIGPGAVDLMMIGCTITLVLLQRAPATEVAEPEQSVAAMTPTARVMQQMTRDYTAKVDRIERGWSDLTEEVVRERRTRTSRNAAEQQKAIEMMLDGEAEAAVEAGFMGASTMRRYVRALNFLRADSDWMAPETEKVRPELVELIRFHVKRESASEVTA